jgi:hypothetical protein
VAPTTNRSSSDRARGRARVGAGTLDRQTVGGLTADPKTVERKTVGRKILDRRVRAGRRSWTRAWTGPLAIVLALVGLFGTGAGLGQASGDHWPPSWWGAHSAPPPKKYPVLGSSQPIQVVIPSINVKAPVFDVGLAADGSIAVPPLPRHNEAGWYDGGPTPGQVGPAILVGHADTRTGPSIFHDLIKLRPGSTVEVTRRDRKVAIFEVNSIEHFDKAKLPGQRVYGDYSRPGLRLITCGGQWIGGSIGYSDNIVVFASLVKSRSA